MNYFITPTPSGLPTAFHPAETNTRLAQLDGDIVRFRKLKNWPELESAAREKMAEIAAFVANWDTTVGINQSPGRGKTNAVRHAFSVKDAFEAWGITQPTVSRWRSWLLDPEAFFQRIVYGTYRSTGFDVTNHRANGTGDNEWFTPPYYVALARAVMGGIDLDPASHVAAQQTVQAAEYYTKADNGLLREWHGRIWLNPPYSRGLIEQFAEKTVGEINAGRVCAAVVLTHAYTDTGWFQRLALASQAICFTRGRIDFHNEALEISNPTQGQAFFYFGPDRSGFYTGFETVGFITTLTS